MFTVQVSKYPRKKSEYISKLTTNMEGSAWLIYHGYNIGRGYKKRLLLNGKVIARFIS